MYSENPPSLSEWLNFFNWSNLIKGGPLNPCGASTRVISLWVWFVNNEERKNYCSLSKEMFNWEIFLVPKQTATKTSNMNFWLTGRRFMLREKSPQNSQHFVISIVGQCFDLHIAKKPNCLYQPFWHRLSEVIFSRHKSSFTVSSKLTVFFSSSFFLVFIFETIACMP